MAEDDRASGTYSVSPPTKWPSIPTRMSWSQLISLEACPRRWALSNAFYENIWDKSGYPRRFSIQQLRGLVVHCSIDLILKHFKANGLVDLRSLEAVKSLRELGGYDGVLRQAIQQQLQISEASPRMVLLKDHIRSKLQQLTPNMRTIVIRKIAQAYNSQGHLELQTRGEIEAPEKVGGGLNFGVHSEVRLRATELGWTGDADEIILTPTRCEIVDSKTGKRKEEHFDQLKTYAALWLLDRIKNPQARLANRLTISYDDGEVSVDGPGRTEIDQWLSQLETRTETARSTLNRMPPVAHPSYENCSMCHVKQLCDSYWEPKFQQELSADPQTQTDYVDAQLQVMHKQNNVTYSALVQSGTHLSEGESIMVKSKTFDPDLSEGATIRVNNLRLRAPNDSDKTKRLIFTRWSERFFVT